jgi:hypothetical protein
MIKTSTPLSPQSGNEKLQNPPSVEDLTEEDEFFFTAIRGHLNNIEEHPHVDTVEAILKYSRSL